MNSKFSEKYSEFSKEKIFEEDKANKKINFEKLEFQNVNFAYDDSKSSKNINLKIKELIGIKGQSGSGKAL